MRCIGWDVKTAKEAGLDGKIPDVKWAKYARKHQRISITFDELKAEQGEQISQELRLRGGKIIRIQGGPEQNVYRAFGKLLFHFPDWYPLLSGNNGVAVIADTRQSCRRYTPEEYHQKYHHLDAEQFTKYLINRSNRPYKPRPRPKKIPPEQSPLT